MPETGTVHRDLEAVLRRLVDQPEQLEVRPVPMRRALVFEGTTAPDDKGKVIGRRGRTVRALRTLLDCRAEREGRQLSLEVLDD